jgi:hypothetical protein
MASPNNSVTSTARPKKQYFCDCSRYCKSRRAQVSRPTYQRHARFRQADVEKRLEHLRTDAHLSTVGTLQLTGQSNGIHQQLGRPMNGADIVQPCITIGRGTAGCGISESDDTTHEASLEAQAPESGPPEVCCQLAIHSLVSSKYNDICRAP